MDTFNTIKYQKFSEDTIDNSSELYKKPVYRKLTIIPDEEDRVVSDLNFNPFLKEKQLENKYFDSETMASFNDIDEYNNIKDHNNLHYHNTNTNTNIDDIKYAGNLENICLEVDDSKNILKSNIEKICDRDININKLEYKTNNLSLNAEKFRIKSKNLYYVMFMKYVYHILAIVLLLIFIIILIVSLVKN
jgi:hypothetical protein